MAQTCHPPTPEGLQAFQTGLQHLIRLRRIPADTTPDGDTQPIYSLASAKLDEADQVQRAELSGWRYFARSATSTSCVVAADITAGERPVLLSLSYAAEAANEYERRTHAPTLTPVDGDDFEVRLLRIPGALVQSFWVKPATASGYIVPFGPSFVEVDTNAGFYRVEDYLCLIKPVGRPPETA